MESIGTISLINANDEIPNGWLECDGSAVSKTTYSDLYQAIGDKYGSLDISLNKTLNNIQETLFVNSEFGLLVDTDNNLVRTTDFENVTIIQKLSSLGLNHVVTSNGTNIILYNDVEIQKNGFFWFSTNKGVSFKLRAIESLTLEKLKGVIVLPIDDNNCLFYTNKDCSIYNFTNNEFIEVEFTDFLKPTGFLTPATMHISKDFYQVDGNVEKWLLYSSNYYFEDRIGKVSNLNFLVLENNNGDWSITKSPIIPLPFKNNVNLSLQDITFSGTDVKVLLNDRLLTYTGFTHDSTNVVDNLISNWGTFILDSIIDVPQSRYLQFTEIDSELFILATGKLYSITSNGIEKQSISFDFIENGTGYVNDFGVLDIYSIGIVDSGDFVLPYKIREGYKYIIKYAEGGGPALNVETNKQVTLTSQGEHEITPTTGYDVMEKVTADVSIPLEFRSISLFSPSESVTLTPSTGFAGFSGVDINVSVPLESKAVNITENGSVDIFPTSSFAGMSKVTANVNVVPSDYQSPFEVIPFYDPNCEVVTGEGLTRFYNASAGSQIIERTVNLPNCKVIAGQKGNVYIIRYKLPNLIWGMFYTSDQVYSPIRPGNVELPNLLYYEATSISGFNVFLSKLATCSYTNIIASHTLYLDECMSLSANVQACNISAPYLTNIISGNGIDGINISGSYYLPLLSRIGYRFSCLNPSFRYLTYIGSLTASTNLTGSIVDLPVLGSLCLGGYLQSDCRVSLPMCDTIAVSAVGNLENLSLPNVISINKMSATKLTTLTLGTFSLDYRQSITFPSTFQSLYVYSEVYSKYTAYFPSISDKIVSMNNDENVHPYEFYSLSDLTEIPESKLSCTFVGAYAFSNCSNLRIISLPECEYIGKGAFRDCYNIEEVYLPKCRFIASYAFYNCSKLSKISIPSLEIIQDNAITNKVSARISEFSVPSTFKFGTTLAFYVDRLYLPSEPYSILRATPTIVSPDYCSSILYNSSIFNSIRNMNGYIKFSSTFTELDFPNLKYCTGRVEATGLTTLNMSKCELIIDGFSNCTNLISVNLDSCKVFQNCLVGCNKLTSLNLPNVEVLQVEGLSSLTDLSIPKCLHIRFIGNLPISSLYAPECRALISNNTLLCSMSNLEVIDLPKCVEVNCASSTAIYVSNFLGCSKLSLISLPNCVTYNVPFGALGIYSALTSIFLPKAESVVIHSLPSTLSSLNLPKCMYLALSLTQLTTLSVPMCEYLYLYDELRLTELNLPKAETIRVEIADYLSSIYCPMAGSVSLNRVKLSCISMTSMLYQLDVKNTSAWTMSEYQNCTLAIYNCENLSYLSLNNVSLTYMSYNSGLEKVYIQNPARSYIRNQAFYFCTNLSEIMIDSWSVIALSGSLAFSGTMITPTTGSILVPSALVDAYKSATNWAYFADRIFPIEEESVI